MDKVVILESSRIVSFLVSYKDVDSKKALEVLKVLKKTSDVVFHYTETVSRDGGMWRIYTLYGSERDMDKVIKEYKDSVFGG